MAELMVARVTIHLAWKLFAPRTAAVLKDGDVAEEKIRQLLLSEFQKIHEHLNALRRKELVAAVAFLETGFEKLCSVFHVKNVIFHVIITRLSHSCSHTEAIRSGVSFWMFRYFFLAVTNCYFL